MDIVVLAGSIIRTKNEHSTASITVLTDTAIIYNRITENYELHDYATDTSYATIPVDDFICIAGNTKLPITV